MENKRTFVPPSGPTRDSLGRYCTTPEIQLSNFSTRVDKQGHEECWEWLGPKSAYGYGIVKMRGTTLRAHRVSWMLFFGDIPEGSLVLHKCNNRSCVNPYHLYLGDNADNMQDAFEAKTHSGFTRRKFSDSGAREIRLLLAEGKSERSIARMLGVSTMPIHNIGKGSRCYLTEQGE